MNSIIEIIKNFCIFVTLCTFAGLCGVWFFIFCLVEHDKHFVGTISERIHDISRVTPRYIKWKANRLLGEQVFSIAA